MGHWAIYPGEPTAQKKQKNGIRKDMKPNTPTVLVIFDERIDEEKQMYGRKNGKSKCDAVIGGGEG